jgi:hypothetical protein
MFVIDFFGCWDAVVPLKVVTAMPLIFAYSTLQEPNVQRTLFGRLLRGASDELKGAELTVATSTTPAGLTFMFRVIGR